MHQYGQGWNSCCSSSFICANSLFKRRTSSSPESEFFGSKISDYMILVFTCGNDLEDNNETLDDYLGRDCSEFLKNTLTMCGNRKVLFDNKTGDPLKKADQLTQLLFLVNVVVEINGGKPYTNDLCKELNKGATKLHNQANEVNSLEGYSNQEQLELMEQMQKSYEEQLKQITAVVESKLRRVENQLAKEQAAWLKTELSANKAQKKSDEEIRKWMIYSVIQLLYYSFHRRE